MQTEKFTVTENRTLKSIPKFEAIDIITIIVFTIIGGLLMTDKPVPEYLIGFAGIGAGTKVYTENQLNKARATVSDKLDLG